MRRQGTGDMRDVRDGNGLYNCKGSHSQTATVFCTKPPSSSHILRHRLMGDAVLNEIKQNGWWSIKEMTGRTSSVPVFTDMISLLISHVDFNRTKTMFKDTALMLLDVKKGFYAPR